VENWTVILAGDIGGTNTRLAFFEGDPAHVEPSYIEIFPSHGHSGLEQIVREYLDHHSLQVESACFGVAGPVRDERVQVSNLPWTVDARQLAGELGIRSVRLLNDLEANAYGIALLQAADLVVLNTGGSVPVGNQALIAAGTGLGEGGLFADAAGRRPFPSEGGHSDFAPRTELEIELLRYLIARYGHVSYERVLSGPGLHNIYDFLRDTGRGKEPPSLADELAHGDPAAIISTHALEQTCDLCVQALAIFVAIYGAEAGNLALKVMATGGVFVGGGIAPRIIDKLRRPEFMEAFLAKGRLRAVLGSFPVAVIVNDKTALLGAGRVALMGMQQGARRAS
jgi:glucokinase